MAHWHLNWPQSLSTHPKVMDGHGHLRDWSWLGGSYGNNTWGICCLAQGHPRSQLEGSPNRTTNHKGVVDLTPNQNFPKFDLANPRPRPWVRLKITVTYLAQHPIDTLVFVSCQTDELLLRYGQNNVWYLKVWKKNCQIKSFQQNSSKIQLDKKHDYRDIAAKF